MRQTITLFLLTLVSLASSPVSAQDTTDFIIRNWAEVDYGSEVRLDMKCISTGPQKIRCNIILKGRSGEIVFDKQVKFIDHPQFSVALGADPKYNFLLIRTPGKLALAVLDNEGKEILRYKGSARDNSRDPEFSL